MKLINREKRKDPADKAERQREREAKREIRRNTKAEARATRKAARKARRESRREKIRFSRRFPFIIIKNRRISPQTRFIKVEGLEKEQQKRDLVTDISAAAVLGAALSMVLALTSEYRLIPFVLPGVLIFCLWAIFAKRLNPYIRLIIAAAFLFILLITAVIMRNYVRDGFGLVMNNIFTVSEEYQAYLYDRFNISGAGYNHPNICMYMTVSMISSLLGLLLAMLPRSCRRAVSVLLFTAAVGLTAYYGITPSWVCTAVLIAALLVSLCNGRLVPTWPLILVAVLLFGSLMLIDPGQSNMVRSANEFLRDTFAYRTAYLPDYEMFDSTQQYIGGDDGTEPQSMLARLPHIGKKKLIGIIAGLLLLAAFIVILIVHMRLSSRRNRIKAGINSEDPVIAVRSMFPYAVRWLRLNRGIDISNMPFSELVPQVRDHMAGAYADQYEKMLQLWQLAAYSDHKITPKDSDSMRDFMEDTIELTKEKLKFKDRLKARFRYAL